MLLMVLLLLVWLLLLDMAALPDSGSLCAPDFVIVAIQDWKRLTSVSMIMTQKLKERREGD